MVSEVVSEESEVAVKPEPEYLSWSDYSLATYLPSDGIYSTVPKIFSYTQ
jgi:hypothetical protein